MNYNLIKIKIRFLNNNYNIVEIKKAKINSNL